METGLVQFAFELDFFQKFRAVGMSDLECTDNLLPSGLKEKTTLLLIVVWLTVLGMFRSGFLGICARDRGKLHLQYRTGVCRPVILGL